ncbi:MAG: HlyC/CorC family transporter [Flavobacteriales bacterium]|jgi:putative hemolysin|nr:HlyC/CorC family transporter [Flavobacteriales bacterium]MBT5933016.1 HlyC/CorC family transporter [Flavobacteriales bacterium]MDC0460340.1 hemolysin family protein [Crocinitomicaceae bacterium]
MFNAFCLILISLLFSAFFSGMELAFLSSNRLKIEVDKSKGTLLSKLHSVFYKNESKVIAFILLGNNISLVIYGISSAVLLEPIIRGWGISSDSVILLLQTLFSTLLVLVAAEFIPKSIVQFNPNKSLKFGTFPLFILYILLYIPTHVILFFSWIILKTFGLDQKTNQKVFSRVDLEHFVDDLSERIESEEISTDDMTLLRNALDFSEVKARDCMVPRTEIISVDISDTLDAVKNLFIAKGLSKIIIYRDSIDNIIGYVHSSDMFKSPKSIKQILLPIHFVPSVITGEELLEKFTEQSGNIAIVTDEYGGTAGMVTLEDVIEEIFGEIEDEHDKDDLLEEKLSETHYRFSARIEIDHINEQYDLKIPESEDYETLGGLVLYELANIPEKNLKLKIDGFTFVVEEVTDRRIETIIVYIK